MPEGLGWLEMLVSSGSAGSVRDQREKKLGENLKTELSELRINGALLNPTQPQKQLVLNKLLSQCGLKHLG